MSAVAIFKNDIKKSPQAIYSLWRRGGRGWILSQALRTFGLMSKQSTGLFLCRSLPRFTSAFTSISGSNPTDYIKTKNQSQKWLVFCWWKRVDSNHRSWIATDLQSVPFGRSGTLPYWSWWTDSNPWPADYKSAALPTELHQRISNAWLLYHNFK